MGTGITSYEKCTGSAVPSLRRNYPVQVLRVLSQLFTAPRGRHKNKYIFGILGCNFISRFSFYDNKNILMKKLICILLMAIGINAVAQKSGLIYDAHAQKRSVPAFNAIKVSSAIDLYLTQSNVNEVAVSASENDIRDQIVTEVVGGTLIIRLGDSGNWFSWKKWGNYNTKAYVSIKDINALSASGASNVHIVGTIESPKMRIKMSGASDLKNANFNVGTILMEVSGASHFKANTQSSNITIDCSGASNVELTGNVDDLAIECSGASDAKLYNLNAKGATIQASGASEVSVNVSQLLKMTASGASSIHYRGDAKITESNSSGASSIKHKYD